MTEAEWLACDDAQAMLGLLRGKASNRKLRLFACGLCRVVWDRIGVTSCRRAVEIAERFADGAAGPSDLHRLRTRACEAARRSLSHRGIKLTGHRFASLNEGRLNLTCETVHYHEHHFLIGRLQWHPDDEILNRAAPFLLREVFGHVWRAPPLGADWRTKTAPGLAEAAYDEACLSSGHLDNARLAVLSDALEEAGCEDSDILAHLRSPGPHVRGCWALDLVLGRG